MEASQEAGLQKHNVQQLTFNGLQTVLAIAMIGVGARVSNNIAVSIISFQCYYDKMQTNVLSFVSSCLFLLFQYRDDCNMGAALFLLVGGGIMLAVNIFSLFAIATPCKCDDM